LFACPFNLKFNNSVDAIFIIDLKGNVIEINDKACLTLGLDRNEILGKSLADYYLYDSKIDWNETFKQMQQENQFIFGGDTKRNLPRWEKKSMCYQ